MSWLFIVRYNHDNWNNLSETEKQEARKAAEDLFPYEGVEKIAGSPIAFKVVDTFRTEIFSGLPRNYRDLTKAERAIVMDEILANLPAGDKGIGWIAIVSDDLVADFKAALGDNASGGDKPLKRMYTVEAIPLNDDQTSKAIYEHMTPSHWS